jgi:hypothetical protein
MNGNDLLQTTDVVVWAKEFMELFGDRKNEIDEGLMIAWFANALCCGMDHQRWKMEPKLAKLKQLILYTDPIVSHLECMTEAQCLQWTEYLRCFPEEG